MKPDFAVWCCQFAAQVLCCLVLFGLGFGWCLGA